MSAAIEESIVNHNKVIVSVLEQLKAVYSKYVCVNPADVRNSYDTIRGIIETKITEIKERKDYIKKCVKDLEECNKPLGEMEKVLKKMSKTSNRGRVGTLHGLCKQTIKQNEIPMDEIEQMVSDFPYDEKSEIEKSKKKSASRGGKNKSSKRNNTKRKTYRAKNGNNKSKKRHLQ